jgi:predicted ribonuclease YlaK
LSSDDPLYFYKGQKMAKRKRTSNQNQSTNNSPKQGHFELRTIKPLTTNQEYTFQSYANGDNLVLHGYAGTGKTFISLYLALDQILNENGPYNKVFIIRSVVASRDIGYLPGGPKEKASVYEEPYMEICDDLFGRGDGYNILKMKNIVDFTTTSFLRGRTFKDAIVIIDEAANMTFHELDTIMTRMGDNTRVIFSGDFRQTDLNKGKEKSGLVDFMTILQRMNTHFTYVEFGKEDIVRSGLVRDYIITKTEMEYA